MMVESRTLTPYGGAARRDLSDALAELRRVDAVRQTARAALLGSFTAPPPVGPAAEPSAPLAALTEALAAVRPTLAAAREAIDHAVYVARTVPMGANGVDVHRAAREALAETISEARVLAAYAERAFDADREIVRHARMRRVLVERVASATLRVAELLGQLADATEQSRQADAELDRHAVAQFTNSNPRQGRAARRR